MISFFEPSIQAIIEGLEETLHEGGDVADVLFFSFFSSVISLMFIFYTENYHWRRPIKLTIRIFGTTKMGL